MKMKLSVGLKKMLVHFSCHLLAWPNFRVVAISEDTEIISFVFFVYTWWL